MTDPPLSSAALARLVLRWRAHVRSEGIGAHLRRRQGHSLEFREYRHYQRGDDIRSVDWRASARLPRRTDLLVRSFEAEEKLTLALLVDNRADMSLPFAMPKLLYALWAVRALTELALEKGDEVVLVRLFTGPGVPVLAVAGSAGRNAARTWTEAMWTGRAAAGNTPVDLDAVLRRLRPSGAAVVISDMLFTDDDGRLARFMRAAQGHRRSLSILQLDTITHETALLRAAQEFRLPRGEGAEGLHLFDEAALVVAATAVDNHLRYLRTGISASGLDWPAAPVTWPDPPEGDGIEMLKGFFAQSFPRSRLLAGLGLGGVA